MILRVSDHAIVRFKERVAPVSPEEARLALSSEAILEAAAFGVAYVKLGTGQRVVLEDGAVVTVLPKETWPGSLGRHR
jgi:hypothetical protein